MTNKVRFVNYPRQYQTLKPEFDGVFEEVMAGGDFILRRHLEAFEKNIAAYVRTKHAIGVNTGTDALYLSAHALGFGPGDEVITVSHTLSLRLAPLSNAAPDRFSWTSKMTL